MEKKRKLPPRGAARSEAGSSKKSRTSGTPPEQSRAPTPQPQVVEPEPLPTTIRSGHPLPTLSDPQPSSLPSSQYQSVAESGVMAESVERSRKKWINEGIFERYWTKPTKKKGVSNENPDNPPKDSMTKLGQCTITIEPHIFDVMMYAVKDTSKISQPPPQPMHRPIIQYGPQPQPQASQQGQFSNMQAPPQGIRPQDSYSQSYGNPGPSPSHVSAPPPMAPNQSPVPPVQHPPQPAPPTPTAPPIPAPAATEAPAKSSDPVIQMLAERAATDQELKALMRIVADGKASPEELRKFQGHIDELTKHVNMRLTAAPERTPSNPQPPVATVQSSGHYQAQSPAPNTVFNGRPHPQNQTPNGRPVQPSPVQQGNHNHHLPPQPQALRSKGPVPPTKPDISGVCFEFIGGSGDRFLFPKYSILEFGPGGSVIASFLIVRKGSSADAKSYDPKLDYYQPVTIRLYAHQSRQLDNLQKVVAPQEEVRKYMDEIMDNMTRAEYVLLAMRLPREEERVQQTEDVPMQNGYETPNGVLWTTPASHGSQKPLLSFKPERKQPTEGKQFQNFMAMPS